MPVETRKRNASALTAKAVEEPAPSAPKTKKAKKSGSEEKAAPAAKATKAKAKVGAKKAPKTKEAVNDDGNEAAEEVADEVTDEPVVSKPKGGKGKKNATKDEDAAEDSPVQEDDTMKAPGAKKGKASKKGKAAVASAPEPEPEDEAEMKDDEKGEEEPEQEEEDVNELELGSSVDIDEYTVSRAHSGLYTCTCKGFKFSKGPVSTRNCKHITDLGYTNRGSKKKAAAAKGGPKASKFKRVKLKSATDAEKETISGKSLPELKELLKANNQLVGGSKRELESRIISCIEFGCLPRCSKCGGGKMKEDGKGFVCPGFMDDTDFQFCGYRSDGSDLKFPVFNFF